MAKILKEIWNCWKKLGLFIANIINTIISIILYISVITPFAILIKIFTDYFRTGKNYDTMWIRRPPKDLSLKDMKNQY